MVLMQTENDVPEILENEPPLKSHIEITEDGEAVSDDDDIDEDDEVEEIEKEDE